jgi:hypothetical protein
MFSVDGVLRNFFFFRDAGWRHSKLCRLSPVLGFWTHTSSLNNSWKQTPASLSYRYIRPMFLFVHLSYILGTEWAQTSENQDLQWLPFHLYCSFYQIWWCIIYLLLCNASTRRMLWGCSAIVTTLLSPWSTAIPVSASFICRPHRRTALTFTIASPYTKQTFEDSSRFFTFCIQEFFRGSLFYRHNSLCHFRINFDAAICRVNLLWLQENNR